jgi:hypothetical protein
VTYSLLRKDHRLRVFENRVLRRIFGSERSKVTGECSKLHNEELHYLYCSPTIVWVIKLSRMSCARHVAQMGEGRGVYRFLVGKPEGKRALERTRCRWEDNIKMGLQEIACRGMDWIELAQHRDWWPALVNVVMNLRVP